LYPGTEITRSNPRLFEAARVFVSRRSKQRGGWPAPWSSCCWSRLGESEKAYACFRSLLTASTHPNFFNGNGAIFQIDGNLGGTAAVVEMLLQSHEGMVVHLLPALPAAWPAGSVRGLVARGGIEVALSWTGGKLDRADLTFRHDGRFQVRYSGKTVAIEARRGSTHRLSGTLEPLPG
jgi:alpha-L-fucosidase 2